MAGDGGWAGREQRKNIGEGISKIVIKVSSRLGSVHEEREEDTESDCAQTKERSGKQGYGAAFSKCTAL